MGKTPASLFLRARKGARREDLTMVRRVTRDAHVYNRIDLKPTLWDAFVFLMLTFALSAIAFLGRPPHAPIVQLHQRPKFTFEAPFDFTYESETALNARRANAASSVLPVFRVDTDSLSDLTRRYRDFGKVLAQSRESLLMLPRDERAAKIMDMPEAKVIPGLPKLIARSASTMVELSASSGSLEFVFNDTISLFEGYSQRGLFDDNTFSHAGGDSAIRLIRHETGRREMSIIEARQSLYQNTYIQVASDAGAGKADVENARNMSRAVAEILQPGLVANIIFDEEATRVARDAASAAEQPVPIEVKKGAPLISRDFEVGQETLERWRAFRTAFAKQEAMDFGLTRTFVTNTLWGLAIMALVVLYSRIAAPAGPRRKRAMSLVALAAIVNLSLLRATLVLAESGAGNRLGETLQWAAPWAFAPLIVCLLVGPHMAIVAALLVSGFASAMNGNSLQVMLASLLASLVAIRVARNVRLRGRIVSAGLLSAVPVAIIAFFDNATLADWQRPETLTIPLATLGSGLFTGVVAAGLLPYLENLFKTTTDITLLELTDYNHPLLRKLQILAPGTFHHSVMVANIAERAAKDIGANALFCRCAALFHDIGKMAKPEYFIENQRPGVSPHVDLSPSMSALVIKSHVREGVEIAKEYRLPRVVIDIIEQHHGTGLISYFFHKACKAAETEACTRLRAAAGSDAATDAVERAVDESGFRYEGPKPQTREAAVILLADSVEAASRSLKKVTPQTVEDLVDAIVSDRIEDGQLDECPLSFKEVRKLRASLKRSLLTSLHQRVEYPASDTAPKASIHRIVAPAPGL